MRVILIRHGPAARRDARRWPDDARRPLTVRGIERTEHAMRGLHRLAAITRVLTSPLTRSTQTAEIVRRICEVAPPPELLPALSPDGDYHRVVERLAECKPAETVALVGHEPDLGKLAGVLIFGAPAATLPFKKSGACIVDFAGRIEPGKGLLRAFLPPRLLRVRGKSRVKS